MYLSRLKIKNWRSYENAKFDFIKPPREQKKPIVLIGAMNGHGKTSFLLSLYLGLFGRFGLRHCEGFRGFSDGNISTYRRAIEKCRRSQADPNEPTEIDITFSPTLNDQKGEEVRIIRRWHFIGNKLRGKGRDDVRDFEELELHVGEEVFPHSSYSEFDAVANAEIGRHLFPDHVAPAFIFDGEQAEALANDLKGKMVKKAIEVMFGSKILEELREAMMAYVRSLLQKGVGKKKMDEREKSLHENVKKMEHLNQKLGKAKYDLETLCKEKDQMTKRRNELREELQRIFGGTPEDKARAKSELEFAEKQKEKAEGEITKLAAQMGLVLALRRLDLSIRRRLSQERLREDHENLRQGTLDKREKVLVAAMPEPPEKDLLLGNIASDVREKIKQRILKAIEVIYDPPPDDMADGFLLGHVKGQEREHVLSRLNEARNFAYDYVNGQAKALRDAREMYDNAKARWDRFGDHSEKTEEIKKELHRLDKQINEAIRQTYKTENEIKKWDADYKTSKSEVARLREMIERLGPERGRIEVAENVNHLLDELIFELKPLTRKRLEDTITKHFSNIADDRFRDGRIVFSDDEDDKVHNDHNDHDEPRIQFDEKAPEAFLSSLSGFEKRSFGIAFSLALAEITCCRFPLIIDTPLGNADSKYRPRTLDALREFDTDQIIILTHDREVTPDLHTHIKDHINQIFLVEFSQEDRRSIVHQGRFFSESR